VKIDFLLKRLTRMSIPEIMYRVFAHYQGILDKSKIETKPFNDQVMEMPGPLFRESLELPVLEALIREADLICNGQFTLFALTDYDIGEKIDYHKDYRSGLSAPRDLYSKDIDYRDAEAIGDIKYIWEPNRHLFLTKLAVVYHLTGESRYLDQFEHYLTGWFDQNPFMRGVNWTSSLELGIRLINWSICMHLVGDKVNESFKERWVRSVYRHCWFIDRNYSRFSSANNHLIGEAAGVYIASCALPRFKDSSEWRERSRKILIKEAARQQYADGINKEQAIAYQEFVFDFLFLSGLIGNRYDKSFPQSYWGTLESMCEFLSSVENVSGRLPQIGDEDDGYVIDVGQKWIGSHVSILNSAALMFNRKDFKRRHVSEDIKTALLMGIAGINADQTDLNRYRPIKKAFENGGYYILSDEPDTQLEQKLIFDCGPLGYLSLAAHGHADALSFYFSAAGTPIFIDPGTYAYHADTFWRNYFRSTKAHNTVCIDNADQSVIAGNFMWSKKADAECLDYKEGLSVKGRHDGYRRLGKTGVLHQREVAFYKADNKWVITDELIGHGDHTIEICFHLDPGCYVESRDEQQIEISFSGGMCRLQFEKNLVCETYYGNELLPLGWYSPAYDRKEPTKTIVLRKQMEGNTVIRTTFQVEFDQTVIQKSSERKETRI
jgi:hypothetical protein